MDKGQQMRNAGLSIFDGEQNLDKISEWDFVGGGVY